MRYSSTINNIKANEWGLNIQQAYLFSWMYELPSWASKIDVEGVTYYFASKTKAVEELPILTDKTDTMYRFYKQLEDLGLIVITKVNNKDYIALTDKSKQWNNWQSDYSENNPSLLGNKSENNSEINPTYNNIILDNNIKEKEKIDFSILLDFYNNTFSKRCTVFPLKAKKAFNDRIKEGYGKLDIKTVLINVSQNEWHIEKKFQIVTLEFLSRSKTFEMYSTIIPKNPNKPVGHINH